MIGRNYDRIGDLRYSIDLNDSTGYPYRGPIKARFINNYTLAVVDINHEIHIQTLSGHVNVTICSEESRRKGIEANENASVSQQQSTDNTLNTTTNKFGEAYNDVDDDENDEYSQLPLMIALKKREEKNLLLSRSVDSSSSGGVRKRSQFTVDPNEKTNKSTSYVDIHATSLIRIPMSKSIAVTDCASDNVKVINTTEWYLDKTIGTRGEKLGQVNYPRDIDCFKVNFEVFYCICDSDNHRIQIINESFIYKASIGSYGNSLCQFRSPVAVACYHPHSYLHTNESTYNTTPAWYLGVVSGRDIDNRMKEADNIFPGNFYVGQRIEDKCIYELHYYNSYSKLLKLILKYEDDILSYTSYSGSTYSCIWELLEDIKVLKKTRDYRPYVYIAVAESENPRVQIFRYYYSDSKDSCLFKPKIYFDKEIKHIDFVQPTSLSYSKTGELCICDMGKHCIYLLSPHGEVIKVVSTVFRTTVLVSSLHEIIRKKVTNDARHTTYNKGKVNESICINDNNCCSCHFSNDNRLCVGYALGGVIVYDSYRSYVNNVGLFQYLPIKILDCIITYFEYHDVGTLRNTCKYFHDYTRSFRLSWQLLPLRNTELDRVVYLYTLWGCKRSVLEEGFDSSSSSGRGRNSDSDSESNDMFVFKELNSHAVDTTTSMAKPNVMCNKYLKHKCNDLHCQKSHKRLDISDAIDTIDNHALLIEYDPFIHIVTAVFGARHLWKIDVFVRDLFHAFAITVRGTKKLNVPMKIGSILRPNISSEVKVLQFDKYMEMMTIIEEDYANCKHIFEHSLFKRKRMTMHAATAATTAAATTTDGTTDGDTGTDGSNDGMLSSMLLKDPLQQYDKGIDVPYVKSKSRHFKALNNRNADTINGSDMSDVQVYNASYKHQVDRLTDSMSLFF